MKLNDYIYYNNSITIHDHTISSYIGSLSENGGNGFYKLREQVRCTCSIYTRFPTTEHLT